MPASNLKTENAHLHQRLSALKSENAKLQKKIVRLEAKEITARNRIKALEQAQGIPERDIPTDPVEIAKRIIFTLRLGGFDAHGNPLAKSES